MKLKEYIMTKCEKCGQIVPYGQHCFSCGSILPHLHSSLQTMKCKVCGGEVPKGTFCTACGSEQK